MTFNLVYFSEANGEMQLVINKYAEEFFKSIHSYCIKHGLDPKKLNDVKEKVYYI